MIDSFETQFELFKSKLIAMLENQKDRTYKQISFENGKRYVRIFLDDCCFAFIDKNTGAVLKPASYKAPAKHSRGNIFDDHTGMKWISPWGVAYLR